MSNLKRMAAIEALEHINELYRYLCSAEDGAALQVDKLSDGDNQLESSVRDNFKIAFEQLEECRGWLSALSSED